MNSSPSAAIEGKVAPIIRETYGDTSMSRALTTCLVGKIDRGDFDSRGREHNVMLECWMWFSGGTTAERVAQRIEEALA